MRASCFRLLALWTALLPPAAAAQWPGEVEGRVVDALTGRGVEAATVRPSDGPLRTLTAASGHFRLRSLAPGVHELVVERVGYEPSRVAVRIENGRTARVVVELVPRALEVEGLTARVGAGELGALRVIPGSAGVAGARTVADLVEALPGVTVTGRGPGASRTVSIRGSSADAVLVLLDGVPLNDPLTGEADLSLVPADAVAEVTVLPGARSARYGARAEAGVILVRTGRGPAGPRADLSTGSLGRTGAALSWTGAAGAERFLSASIETLHGRFDFERDASVGGGPASRANADLTRWGVRGGTGMELLGGTTRLRAGVERAERGLPGRSFAPSPEARQAERRLHLSAGWSRPGGALPAEVEVYAARHRSRFRDPAPSAGLPYDETSRVGQVGVRGRLSHPSPPGPFRELAVGWALEGQGVETDALEGGPVGRTDVGAYVTAGLPLAGDLLDARGVARLDRDGLTGAAVGSHEVELRATPGPLTLRVAHRSSYSPPALSDRFFRAGVGVEPNPDLRAVRVPSELEAGLSAGATRAGWSLDASVDVYRADVRGMIVWSPDHRFVWSPRNVDVLRRGAELRLDGTRRMGSGRLRLSSSWSLARVTYTRADLRGVQLRYRPRHEARVAGSWEAPDHDLSVQARYVGSRLPVPSDVNRLPGFWTVDLTAGTTVRVGGWRVEPRLRVDRVRDVRDSMIFAFPEPGRTVGLELTVRPPPGRR